VKPALIAAAALLAFFPTFVQGQGSVPRIGFGVELRVGLAAAVSLDEVSLEAPAFRVWPQELAGTTRFDGVLLLPAIGGRIRPHARVALTPNARVEGLLINDQALCPTCRDAFAGQVDRLDLMAGAEVSLFPETRGRVRPYAGVSAGLRHYSYSYDAFDGPGGVPLEGNSFSETGALGRLGLGLGLGFGSREVNLEGSMQAGQFGAGTPSDSDYGREIVLDFGLSLGLRQNF
jgi:hypothetical protein